MSLPDRGLDAAANVRLGRQLHGALQGQPSGEDALNDVGPKLSGDAVSVFHDSELAKPVLGPLPLGLRAIDPVPEAVRRH
jgi:hypothetical protein